MTILRTVKRRSPLAGFAIASIVLMWTGLSAQSAEQQIVADASTALGGRERILAVKTLIVEGGGRDLNVGQSLRFDDLGLQSDVWQIREYKRAYDLANTRARFEAIREAQYPFYQGEAAPRLIQGLDGEIAFNVNAEGNATRIFGPQATGRLAEVLAASAHVGARAALQPTARLSNARTQGSERLVDVTIGGATLTLAIDATTKLPTRVIQMTDSATLGDTPVETRFAGYEAVSGLQLPTRLTTRTDRWLSAEVRIMRQSVDGTVGDLVAPPNVRAATQPAAPVPPDYKPRNRQGRLVRRGTTHKSLLAEFSDHMLLIEAPNNERVRAVLAKARELRPNKPVTKLLVTHHHGDHTSGVRLAVAEGVH